MRKFFYLSMMALISIPSILNAAPGQHHSALNQKINHPMQKAALSCQTLACVRAGIDEINKKIVSLIGERLAYVKRAGELKNNKRSVHDQKREDAILASVSQQAETLGYSPDIASAVFKTILEQSNHYEKVYHHYQQKKTS